MKIVNIKIDNYRLLQDFTIDLEETLSLVIGKNNSGKTSFLSLLERFLHTNESNKFTFDDLNIEGQQKLKKVIESKTGEAFIYKDYAISLKLYIEYNEKDNLSNISTIMLDLNPTIKTVVLSFEYSLSEFKFSELKEDFAKFNNETEKILIEKFKNENITDKPKQLAIRRAALIKRDIIYFLKKYHAKYFEICTKALEFKNEDNYINLTEANIKIDKIINFKRIKAKRDVANEDGTSKKSDNTLSKMSGKYYEKISNDQDGEESIVKLQNELSDTDDKLNVVYGNLFENVINKVKKFGGIKEDDSKLMIISTLQEKNILSNNTTVMYEHSTNHSLPEDYNGLGYMNLIAMIFEIEVLLSDFKKKKFKDTVPADINLLFIEEPEAHTHPQMQYVFIKNIKTILEDASNGTDDGIKFNLQSIITTHSSHITADSDFNDIKYFHRATVNKVIAKNLKDLQKEYNANPKDYQFLKQYLTLNRTELFFADKAVFIEGDTERLLLSAIMRKIDEKDKVTFPDRKSPLPLLSQNISIVEVGAYSQIFEKFIDFLGIKTLIITDLDAFQMVKVLEKDGITIKKNKDGSEREEIEKCRVKDGIGTSNGAIKFFYDKKKLDELIKLTIKEKKFSKIEKDSSCTWKADDNGKLCVVYQTEESGYHARSFEDAFISVNLEFVKANRDVFKSLKNRDLLDSLDFFDIADRCIDKKTLFALDILFLSDEKFENWKTPGYINEGLLWLKN